MTTFDSRDALNRRAFLSRLGVGVIAGVGALGTTDGSAVFAQMARPRPTASQLAWQRDEVALFVHFGINTFTDREWGDGTESPALFNPLKFDAVQWARAARSAGAKAMILTAKHHDGFCLWPTATTTHSVASSPWREGRGDVVRDFVTACRDEGMSVGLYCSPWDRNHPAYGDSGRYNDVYLAQLTELLTRYGTIGEVWFDGANGEGPNGKRQVYDWPRIWGLVRRLQPEAVIFSDAGPDVRWIGNERGVAGETNWSTIRPESVPYIGAGGDDVTRALQEGHADGSVWRPGETDVSIRPGWFHHPAEDTRVKSVEELETLYFTSVGRNSKLLLNVPPTREGLMHETDVSRLAGMRVALDRRFSHVVPASRQEFRVTGARQGELIVALHTPQPVALLDLREQIAEGQRVAAWRVTTDDGARVLARGTTIGHRQLRRIAPVVASTLSVHIETVDAVLPITLHVYG